MNVSIQRRTHVMAIARTRKEGISVCALFGFKGNASIPNGCKGNATQDRVMSYYTFMSTMAYFGST